MGTNSGGFVQFDWPWALLLLPLCAAFILWVAKKARTARVHTAVRLLSVVLLILAIAGTALGLPGGKSGVFILADVSASTSASRAAMDGYVRKALEHKQGNVDAGVIAFGREAMVETPLSALPRFTGFQTMPDTGFTDLEQALTLGSALLPGGKGRLLLLSDGRQNMGDALKAASVLAAQGVTLDAAVIPSGIMNSDAQVSEVKLPSMLYEGESFDVRVRVDATAALSGTLRLMLGAQQLAEQPVALTPGENQFVFRLGAEIAGVQAFTAVLDVAGDQVLENDRLSAATEVVGRPVVLLVEGVQGEARELEKMLAAQGLRTRTIGPKQIPDTLEGLRAYHAVVLCNVSSDDVSEKAMLAMEETVQKLGRGLVMTGGEQSFALGGWKNTPVERMLPVSMDVSGYMDAPDMALMLVIDRSGSMMEGEHGITRLDMAIEAAARSMEAVREGKDQVGVIAFDDSPYEVLPLAVLQDVKAAQDLVATLRPGGGTMMYAPLKQAMDQLDKTQARIKHIIALTDGQPADSGFEALAQQMQAKGITLSTVGVGQGANGALLKSLAETGQGRYYACDAFTDIPKIFTQETYLATGAYLQIRTFTPAVTGANPVVDAFDGFPKLDGYIGTTLKGAARSFLVSDVDEPVYAAWQYGLGRTAAWTSDVTGAMSGQWLAWGEGARFFAGLIGDVLPSGQAGGRIEGRVEGDQGITAVEWEDGTAAGRDAQAVIIAPDGTEQRVPLVPVSPGRMEAGFAMPLEGSYIVRVETTLDGADAGSLEMGLSRPWSPEYDLRQSDADGLLRALVQKTGGRILKVDKPEDAFNVEAPSVWKRVPLSPWLAALALLIFLFDVVQRRLGLNRYYAAWGQALRARIVRQPKPAIARDTAPAPVHAPVQAKTDTASMMEIPAEKKGKTKPAAKKEEKASDAPTSGGGLSSQLLSARKQQKKKWQ